MVLMDSVFFDIGFKNHDSNNKDIQTKTIYNEKDNEHISLYIEINI